MPTNLAESTIAANPLQWRDALVRAVAIDAPPGRTPPAFLTEIGDGGAALIFPAAGRTLILLLWPPAEPSVAVPLMRDRLQRIQQSTARGAHVVIMGGGAAAMELCRSAQPVWRLRQRTSLHQLSEDGSLWSAGSGFKPLEAAVAASRNAISEGRVLDPLTPDEVLRARERFRQLATVEQSVATSLKSRQVPGTIGLLVAITAVFALEMAWGGPDAPGLLYRMGASDRTALFHGEWWRLISPAFLHAGYFHILVNGWSLWVLGVLLERLFGTARFLVLYTVGTIVAALSSATFNAGLSVGASGAIFALMGALIAIAWQPRGLLPPTMVARLRQSLWAPLIANVAISMAPSVDWHAHLGGTVGGLALVGSGVLVRGLPLPGERKERTAPSPGWIAAAVLSVGLLAAGVGAALWHGRAWDQSVGPLARVTLGDTHLSLELPERLPLTGSDHEAQGRDEFAFGGLSETPLMVSVLVVTDPALTGESAQTLATSLRDEAAKLNEPPFVRQGDPTVQITPAGPVVHFSATRDDGVRKETWLTVRGSHLVRIDVASTPQTTTAWQELSPTLAASLRDDGATTPK